MAVFLIDPSRAGDIAVAIFGDPWPGNLVADDYAGDNAIHPARRQSCLAHLMTKAKDLAQPIRLLPVPQQDPKALTFCERVREFLAGCCGLGHARNTGAISVAAAQRQTPRLQKRLRVICRDPLADPAVENLRQRLIDPQRSGAQLFTFLTVNGIRPPTTKPSRACACR